MRLSMFLRSISLAGLALVIEGLCLSSAGSKVADAPRHLTEARQLVSDLRGTSMNVYGGGKREIDWTARPVQARTVCSSFTTLLLQHAYGWDSDFVKKWLGGANPGGGGAADV